MIDMLELKPGHIYLIEGELWGICNDCHKLLKLSGLLGGIHICV